MHITKVVIEGFKSFKEKTTFEFLPGLNFVVGHDEAGKNNLLYAIQFALAAGHQFQQGTQTNLVKLLYSSSSGIRVKSAYVEITIDNQDKSIHEQGNEIRMKRMITSSKDVYSVNGQSTNMEKMIKTLLSKLSKANPYYIISHNQTQEICTSSTKKSLAMLCEMTGFLKDLESIEESIRENDSFFFNEETRKKKLEKELEADRTSRQELWKKIRVIEARLKSTRSGLEKIRSNIRKIASEGVLQGMESVWTIVNQMKEEEEFKDLALEYRGLVIEQFECPTEYMIAVDAITKNRLFQHVVDTNRASTEIRKRMAEKMLPGYANFITNTHSYLPVLFQKSNSFSLDNANEIMLSIDVVEGIFDKFILCPNTDRAREFFIKSKFTCATLDGYVMHAQDDVPGGFSSPNLTRFKLIADYKDAKKSENIKKSQMEEQKSLLKEIDITIKSNEAEYQQIKFNITFQTEHKSIQGSLKLLEAEISSLREWIKSEKEELELGSVFSLQELNDLMKELALLKVEQKNLLFVAENLKRVNALNKKFTKIALAVESLEKQWLKTHVKILRDKVSNKRPNMNDINQQLSLVKAEIEDTILLVNRTPFDLLDRDDGFSPCFQFIVTTLNPGLLRYADNSIIGLRFDDATQSSRIFKVSKKEARQYLDQPVEN